MEIKVSFSGTKKKPVVSIRDTVGKQNLGAFTISQRDSQILRAAIQHDAFGRGIGISFEEIKAISSKLDSAERWEKALSKFNVVSKPRQKANAISLKRTVPYKGAKFKIKISKGKAVTKEIVPAADIYSIENGRLNLVARIALLEPEVALLKKSVRFDSSNTSIALTINDIQKIGDGMQRQPVWQNAVETRLRPIHTKQGVAYDKGNEEQLREDAKINLATKDGWGGGNSQKTADITASLNNNTNTSNSNNMNFNSQLIKLEYTQGGTFSDSYLTLKARDGKIAKFRFNTLNVDAKLKAKLLKLLVDAGHDDPENFPSGYRAQVPADVMINGLNGLSGLTDSSMDGNGPNSYFAQMDILEEMAGVSSDPKKENVEEKKPVIKPKPDPTNSLTTEDVYDIVDGTKTKTLNPYDDHNLEIRGGIQRKQLSMMGDRYKRLDQKAGDRGVSDANRNFGKTKGLGYSSNTGVYNFLNRIGITDKKREDVLRQKGLKKLDKANRAGSEYLNLRDRLDAERAIYGKQQAAKRLDPNTDLSYGELGNEDSFALRRMNRRMNRQENKQKRKMSKFRKKVGRADNLVNKEVTRRNQAFSRIDVDKERGKNSFN